MVYKRLIQSKINEYIANSDNKILFIWGPRRSGKTTLLRVISEKHNEPIFNFDSLSDRELFIPRLEVLANIAKSHKLVLIDEVQNYPESTVALKLLHDEFNVKIIATGSSELRQKSAKFDTLAGRFNELFCLPLSLEEKVSNSNVEDYRLPQLSQELLNDSLLYGSYPEVYSSKDLNFSDRVSLLENIIDTYILKDVINIYELKNVKLAKDILLKIALQVGSEVSIREIASSLDANVVTVTNYIEIFAKNYVLITLPSFKTNARRAVSQNKKFYFYDLGIRNALVKDFRDINLRPDNGGVFESFVISEIEKLKRNHDLKFNIYFYREYSGKEIDLVIEDYKKNYYTVEIKMDKDIKPQNIFPIESKKLCVNRNNINEVLSLVKQGLS